MATDDWGGIAVEPTPKTDDWGGVPVAPANAAPQAIDLTNPSTEALFQHTDGAKVMNAAQGNWFTRPFKAAGMATVKGAVLAPTAAISTAVKTAGDMALRTLNAGDAISNAYDGALSSDSIKDLQAIGAYGDYKDSQSKWMATVKGAVLAPTAAISTAGKTAGDIALRTLNAGISGTAAVVGGLINDAEGAAGAGRENPEAVAKEAQDFTDFLYLNAGMAENGAPIIRAAADRPKMQEVMEMPKFAEKSERGVPVLEAAKTPPALKAPVENPMIDKESGNLNLKYIRTSDGVKTILANSAQAVADRDGVVIPNEITKSKGQALVDQAMQERSDGIPEVLAERMRGDPTNEAQLYAARLLTAQAGEEVFRLGKIAQQTGDARDYEALEASYDRLMSINGIRHDISATLARGTQSHQIVIGGEDAAATISGMSKEDAMRTAMTLPSDQAVAKMTQDMKKPGWGDMAIFHYINWLLSNPITHAAYAAAGEIQKVVRVGLENTVSVGIGAVQRALGSGLEPAQWAALQKERETIEARLAQPKLKARESGQLELRLKEITEKQKMGATRMPAEMAGRFHGAGQGYIDGIRAVGRTLKTGQVQMFPGEEAKAQEAFKKAEADALEEGKSAEEAHKAGQAAYNRSAIKIDNPILERAKYIDNPLMKNIVSGYGKIVGIPGVMASAIHTFQKFAGYAESDIASAYRQAAMEGITDDAKLGARIAQLRANPTAERMKEAAEDGKYASMINKPGAAGQKIEEWAHVNGWTRFLMPFSRIATNLTSQSVLERTPIGIMSPVIRGRLMGAEGNIAQSDAIARMAVGTGIATAGGWLAAQGIVNGVGSVKPNERAMAFLEGKDPLTVRIADHNFPLRLFGLPGRVVSLGAAAYDAFQGAPDDKDIFDATGHLIHVVSQNILQENALKGLADFLDAVAGHDKEMSKNYALNALSTIVVPTGVNQLTRLEDPYIRSTMGNGFMDRLQKTIDARLPWDYSTLYPRVDIFGRPMERNTDHDAAMKDPVIQTLMRLNMSPSHVEPRIGNVRLNDQQFFDYSTKAGALYYNGVSKLVKSSYFSKLDVKTQAEMIMNVQSNARATARQYMLMSHKELAKSIADYNMRLLRGGK